MTIKKELVFNGYDASGAVNLECLVRFFDKKTDRLKHKESLRCSFRELQRLVEKHFGHKDVNHFYYISNLSPEQFKDFQPYLTYVPNFSKLDVQIGLVKTTDPVTEYVPIPEDDQEKGG